MTSGKGTVMNRFSALSSPNRYPSPVKQLNTLLRGVARAATEQSSIAFGVNDSTTSGCMRASKRPNRSMAKPSRMGLRPLRETRHSSN